MDLPGHGTRYGVDELNMRSCVNLVKEVVDKVIEDDDYVIYGFALGGYVAMHYVSQHPENVVYGPCFCAYISGLVLTGCFHSTSQGSQMGIIGIKPLLAVVPPETRWKVILNVDNVSKEDINIAFLNTGFTFRKLDACDHVINTFRTGINNIKANGRTLYSMLNIIQR